ncbi:hypothetical protein I350_00885 [Cryptococcus amylolentus CBS 6273]|uniref:Uncharacterized protein n=1 Tax=Cryptococcus amylolentus CBS 6273 TaxID=1296118 RepID=A0A1E3KG96_9TREE|nr:hypothetical protein I350_00885 [Cryptococcus amylolentus CBS 6273]
MSGGYEFSHLFSASTIAFSPGTTFLATAHHNRIVVRSTATLQVVRTWACTRPPAPLPPPFNKAKPTPSTAQDPLPADEFTIDSLQWSRDSMYLLVYSSQVKMAWVYGIAQEGESARIGGMGVEGLLRVEWGRAGRDVLSWQEFDTKMNIYDLSTGNTSVIQNAKTGHTYSHDSRYIAVAEKHYGKEYIGVYDVLDQYALIRHHPLHTTDVQGIEWSPCGRYIAVWDSPLSYSLHIHSALGPLLAHFTPSSPTFSSTPNEISGLGIKLVTWAPSGRWIAVGGWDGKVRVLENEGWRCVCVVAWGTRAVERSSTIWREPGDWLRDTRGRGIVQFDRQPHPCTFPTNRPDSTKPMPRTGISQLTFNPSSTLLLIRLDSQPNTIHLHTFLPTPTSEQPTVTHLASGIFAREVRRARWNPRGNKLAVATGGGGVYVWDEESGWVEEDSGVGDASVEAGRGGNMEAVGIPTRTEFSAIDLQWSPDGTALVIQDRAQFCLLYDGDSAEEAKEERSDEEESQADRSSFMWDGVGEGLHDVLEEGDE